MKKKTQFNGWEMKCMKRDQHKYFAEQSRKNELLVDSLGNLEKAITEMQSVLSLSVKDMDHNLSKKLERPNRKTMEVLQTLHEDLNQTQELVKILVANQLIDQI